MEPEKKGVVRGEPGPKNPVALGEGESDKGFVEREENTRGGEHSPPRGFFWKPRQRRHYRNDGESAHYVVGDVPERAVEVDRKERGRMNPRKEREGRERPRDGVFHSSLNEKYCHEAYEQCGVVCWSDAEKPVGESLFGSGRFFVSKNRFPIRNRTEHSPENEEKTHRDRKHRYELVEIPIEFRKVLDGALLVEMVYYHAQTGEGSEAREALEGFFHARIVFPF
jgi:hypothetical protein